RRAPGAPDPRGARLLERDAARRDVADRAGHGHRRRADRGPQGDGRETGSEAVPAVRGALAARLPARACGGGADTVRRLPRRRAREPVTELVDPVRLARWMDER